MKTRLLDSPAKRMSIVAAILGGIILVAAAIYLLPVVTGPLQRADGLKIVGAARAYTRSLVQNHQPVPSSVQLQTLIDQGFLKAADAGSLQGMDAAIFLAGAEHGPTPLMRVHLPDGADLVLLGDGSMREIKR